MIIADSPIKHPGPQMLKVGTLKETVIRTEILLGPNHRCPIIPFHPNIIIISVE